MRYLENGWVLLVAGFILCWLGLHTFLAGLDKDYCESRGLQYGYTTAFMVGYCKVSGGFEIPITYIWQEEQ